MCTKSDLEWSRPFRDARLPSLWAPVAGGRQRCPDRERRLRENALTRAVHRGRTLVQTRDGRTVVGIPERAFYAVGALAFATIAVASAIFALLA